jgi:hypothetical protein
MDDDVSRYENLKLPKIFGVVEGNLVVSTDDEFVGHTALLGLKYLLALEFARQQPALSLLYDLEFAADGPYSGSQRYEFKVLVRLKKRLRSEMRKAGPIGVIALVLGLPGCVHETLEVIDRLFPSVQTGLSAGMPSVNIRIEIQETRVPKTLTSSDANLLLSC